MKTSWMPVVLTVGQVMIFPYYILWLRELALTYTLFALLFAVHSFAAALGYSLYKRLPKQHSALLYIASGALYSAVLFITTVQMVVMLQLALGLVQGYFRAWHLAQKSYKANAVQHYIAVGCVMVMLAFIQLISPVFIIASFGVCLVIGGFFIRIINNN